MRRRAMLVVAAMVGALIVGSGVALAANYMNCAANPCSGTADSDIITGTLNPEVIQALAGNDSVDALDGNDYVYGGPDGDGTAAGADFDLRNLEGGEGSDTVYGGGGADFIDAAANDTSGSVDRSYGGGGNDRIYAADGNEDIINCGKGRDVAIFDKEIDTTTGCEKKTGAVVVPI